MQVSDGIVQDQVSLIHARSVAEDVVFQLNSKNFSGSLDVVNGNVAMKQGLVITGKSLLHSAPLTTEAFASSWLGSWGRYIVAIGLLLFAFSTSISWSYYGERAVIYLFGIKYILYYRLIYVLAFFVAAFVDTTIVWIFSGVTIALMTLPNLVGILLMRKEMKSEVRLFWDEYRKRFPDEKTPKY